MRKMLLSFKPEVYEKIKSGKKIFEHRRNFPDEPIMAYMYVSAPVKAITGIVYLGKDIFYPIGKKNLKRIRMLLLALKNIKNHIDMLWRLMSFRKPQLFRLMI